MVDQYGFLFIENKVSIMCKKYFSGLRNSGLEVMQNYLIIIDHFVEIIKEWIKRA